jgi:hypothetical protein
MPGIHDRDVQVFACDISTSKFPKRDGPEIRKIFFSTRRDQAVSGRVARDIRPHQLQFLRIRVHDTGMESGTAELVFTVE